MTENFAPPEVHNDEIVSFKSDVWSLGCLLYFMVTKIKPWEKNSRKLPLSSVRLYLE